MIFRDFQDIYTPELKRLPKDEIECNSMENMPALTPAFSENMRVIFMKFEIQIL